MPIYKCPRCGYNSHIKTYLHKHFLRKNICKPIFLNKKIDECYKEVIGLEIPNLNKKQLKVRNVNPDVNPSVNANVNDSKCNVNDVNGNIKKYKCNFCDKNLKSRQGRYQHQKICKKKNNIGEKKNNIPEEALQLIKQQSEQIEIMKHQIEKILDSKSSIQPSTSNINTQNIHGDQHVNIYINAFGKENVDYITDKIVSKLIVNSPMNAIPQLLQNIHFHPKHTENHNIFIPNKKDSLAKVYDGERWVYRKKKEAIQDMATKAITIIENTENGGNIEHITNNYFDGDKKIVNRIHDDTEIMILNEGNKKNKG